MPIDAAAAQMLKGAMTQQGNDGTNWAAVRQRMQMIKSQAISDQVPRGDATNASQAFADTTDHGPHY